MYQKLIAAQSLIECAHKDALNEGAGYAYASSEEIIRVARAALHHVGLALFRKDYTFKRAGKDHGLGPKYAGKVCVEYVLCDEDSGMVTLFGHESFIPMHSEMAVWLKDGCGIDKCVAAALTFNLSYVLVGLLLIPRQEDNAVDARNDVGAGDQHKRYGPFVTTPEYDALRARKTVKSCVVRSKLWNGAVVDLGTEAFYQKDGQPDTYKMLQIAARLGHKQITNANTLQIVTELRVWAQMIQEEEAAERARLEAEEPQLVAEPRCPECGHEPHDPGMCGFHAPTPDATPCDCQFAPTPVEEEAEA